jgi:hypothetical protein
VNLVDTRRRSRLSFMTKPRSSSSANLRTTVWRGISSRSDREEASQSFPTISLWATSSRDDHVGHVLLQITHHLVEGRVLGVDIAPARGHGINPRAFAG